jgi:tetratricopeptide (TPR) repeat protein
MSDVDRLRYDRIRELLNQKPADIHLIDEALGLALAINDEYRSLPLGLIVAAYLASEALDSAESIARKIPDPYDKAQALRKVAAALLGAQRMKHAEAVLHDARNVTTAIEIYPDRADALALVGDLLYQAGLKDEAYEVWDEAVAIARKGEAEPNAQHSLDSSSVLGQVAESLALVGDWVMAREIAHYIKSMYKRDRVFERLRTISDEHLGKILDE